METPRPRKHPPAAAALFLFTAVLVSNIALGPVLHALGITANWALLGTPLVVLFWTGLAAWFLRVDPKETFLLRLPSASDVLMAIPLAISFVVLNDQLSSLTDAVFPIPEEFRLEILRILRIETPLEAVFKVSTIAAGAAVSEELMFRGFIQSAFGSSMSRTAAVIWTSFFFMAIHMFALPSYVAAGLVLGFVAVASGSILVPMLIHFINNAAALALVNWTDLETLGDPVWIPAPILVPASLIFALTTTFFARRLLSQSPRREEPAVPAERSDDVVLPMPPLADELQSISPERRRLGWIVVGAGALLGVSVLLGLSAYSVYLSRPQVVHEAFIEALSRTCVERLAPEAFDRSAEIESAFASLSAANHAGTLTWRNVLEVLSVSASVGGDGSIDADEVDRLLDGIRETVRTAAAPRRL